MAVSFHGKRAIVTGAGQGIGLEIAKRLVQCGAQVVAMDFDRSALQKLKAEFPEIETVEVDLSDWKATENATKAALPVDLVVNNAGIAINEEVGKITEKAVDKVLAVNTKAVINISQIAAEDMKSRKVAGSIVNISSQASKFAMKEHTVYAASKAAVDLTTKVMALELGPHQIRCNSINPTVVDTELGRRVWQDPAKSGPMIARIPLGKFALPEDIVNAVVFLLSDQSRMITGVNLSVDGGTSAC